jgi:hypothetical protein
MTLRSRLLLSYIVIVVLCLGIAAVSSPLEVGAAQAPALLDQLQAALGSDGNRLETCRPPKPVTDAASAAEAGRHFYEQRVDAVCVVAACWFEDYLVLDMLEECDVPVIAWARPGMETGSLCGVQQLGFMLKQLGKPYLFLFDEVGAVEPLTRMKEFTAAAALRRHLRREPRLLQPVHEGRGGTEQYQDPGVRPPKSSARFAPPPTRPSIETCSARTSKTPTAITLSCRPIFHLLSFGPVWSGRLAGEPTLPGQASRLLFS